MNFQPFVVKEITEESADIRTFKVTKPDGTVPSYQPGHFFLLRLKDETGKLVQRSYSVASCEDEGMLWFCVKLKGAFTHLLWKLQKGDSIELDGPYGIFLMNPSDTERVFIGGGVGISALRSMILRSAKESKRSSLFHSARTFDGLTYFQEMKKLASENPLFKFYPSITGEEKPPGWNGYSERISVQMLKDVLGTFSEKTFYFCGSKEMGAEISAALMAAGVPKERIKKDEWV